MVSQAFVVVVTAALSVFTPDAFSNLSSTGIFGSGDHTDKLKTLSVVMSILFTGKLTPAKAAFDGTVFCTTVVDVLAPDASGFAIARVEEPLKSEKFGACPPSSVIGRAMVLGTVSPNVILSK